MLGSVLLAAPLEGCVSLARCWQLVHLLASFARITRNGAHGLIPRSLASSATSHGPIPPLLWARAINSGKRSLGVLGAAPTNLSWLGGEAVEVEAIGRPGGV
jgi:hypothetical protein